MGYLRKRRGEKKGCTSTPSILQENLFACHNFAQPFFWKLSHTMSGVPPEHELPSVELICGVTLDANILVKMQTNKNMSDYMKVLC